MNTVTMMINLHVRDNGLLESIHVNGSRVPTASSPDVGYNTDYSEAANMPAPPPPDVLRKMFGGNDNDSVDREAPKKTDYSSDSSIPKFDADAPPSLTTLGNLPSQGGSTMDMSPPDIDANSGRDSDEYPPEFGITNTSSPTDELQPPAV